MDLGVTLRKTLPNEEERNGHGVSRSLSPN